MRKALIYTAIGLIALIVVILVIQFTAQPTLAQWRDLAVIVVALFFLIGAILMVGVGVAMFALIALLRSKLPPLLDKANSTTETVRGTTGFVSERVVSPFIKVSAAAAGARAAVQTLVRRDNEKA